MSSIGNADYLLQQAQLHGIREPRELANFMGQMQVECGGFLRLSENLHYSGRRLMQVFPGRNGMSTLAEANAIAADRPEAVANAIYGGRWGKLNLGNTSPGDGWKYRGRGYVQLTGRDNYESVGEALGLDLVTHPELAEEREIAARIALYYWNSHVVANGHQSDVRAACRDINGGTNGLAEREAAAAAWKKKIDLGQARSGGVLHLNVRKLQQDLSDLGYHDARGHALKADGDFGPNTRSAVAAFQRDHHLLVDGKVGARTQHALDLALQQKAQGTVIPLDDLRHPGHALYRQALAGVQRIDAQLGHRSDTRTENLAAALAVAAQRQGLSRIDQVVLSEDGQRAFASRESLPARTAHVQTADAIRTSIMDSSIAWATASQQATCPNAPTTAQAVLQASLAPQAIGR